MPRGGRREGGGRPKGSANKLSDVAVIRAAAEGEMPLDYMLSIMRNPEASDNMRFAAAQAAAPYCHSRRTVVAGDENNPLMVVGRIERVIVKAIEGDYEDVTTQDGGSLRATPRTS